MYKRFLFFIFLNLISINIYAKNLIIEGLSKYTLNDIQSITSIDIFNDNLELIDIDKIIRELSSSDLIYELQFSEYEDNYIINLNESDIIENIYINNNVWIKDELIKQNLVSQNNYLLTKRNIKEDLNIIKTIYKSKGFQNISVTSKVERYSKDRINLIYEITENKQQKISVIKFIGNNFYSDKFLSSIIESQSVKFYNFSSQGVTNTYF